MNDPEWQPDGLDERDMSELNFTKMVQPRALAIAAALDLSAQARTLLVADMTPEQYVQQLLDKALNEDAILFLAAGLSKRESTWWACLCARQTLGDKPSEADVKAITLAEAWVYKPTQENSQPNLAAAQATEFKTPAGWSAMAAFWSGDNISPSDSAVVPPPGDLTGKAVNGAVLLAAAQGEPGKSAEYQQLFIKQGIDIASGGDGRQVQ